MDIVDTQIHIPRMVVDGWPSGRRAAEAEAPRREAPGVPLVEPADRDVILAATITAMDAAGVGALVIDEWLGQNDHGISEPGEPVGDGGVRWNFDFSTYAVARYPERFSFLSRVHPLDPELDEVVARLAAIPGMRALRADPLPWLDDIDRFADGGYAPLFRAAARHGVPMMVWSSGRFLPNLEQYLEAFPQVQFILDHMGV